MDLPDRDLLLVLEEHAAQVSQILIEHDCAFVEGTSSVEEIPHLAKFYSAGDGDYVEAVVLQALADEGIAYTLILSKGGLGEDFFSTRFTPTERVNNRATFRHLVKPGELPARPFFEALMKLSRDDPYFEKLPKQIKEELVRRLPFPWEKQAEYGRRYRARQLLTQTNH